MSAEGLEDCKLAYIYLEGFFKDNAGNKIDDMAYE